MKAMKAMCVAVLLGLLAAVTFAGGPEVREYVLFNGENRSASSQDTTEYASYWINVRGASRIVLRTWSSGAAADTAYNDTLTTFKVLFSDSVSKLVTGPYGRSILSAADSVMVNAAATAFDTTFTGGVIVQGQLPINRPLKASATASGVLTNVLPLAPGATTPDLSGEGRISKTWMRVRALPKIRMTTAGFSSTAGIRTAGVNALKMTALVYYPSR